MTLKRPLTALALLLALAAPASAGSYVRLSEIAGRYGLEADTDLITGRTTLTDGTNRVAFLPGARGVLVNGSYAQLPDRVGTSQGELIVPIEAVAFIDRHIQPRPVPAPPVVAAARPATVVKPAVAEVERPAAIPVGTRGTIVLDPGHGGVHTGARGRMGVVEKEVNLSIARMAKDMLEAKGWKVVLTRAEDRHFYPEVNADLDARVAIASRVRANLFVSIHTNYATTDSARGFEVYHAAGRSADAELATAIDRALKAAVDDEDRGVKTAGFRVIKRAIVPAVLVEVGFVSHPATERRLATEEYRRKLAEAIVRGIERWRGR